MKKEYYQFKFSDNFTTLENEKVIDYYKSFDEVPDYMKEFIYDEVDKNYIKDDSTGKLYCPICLSELNDSYCNNCKKSFELKKERMTYIKELKRVNGYRDLRYHDFCCAFDFKDDNILLYCFTSSINYRVENTIYIHRILRISLTDVFSIEKDRIVELISNRSYMYDDIDEFLSVEEIKEQFMDYFDKDLLNIKLNKNDKELLDRIYYNFFCEYIVYKDNLDELKKYNLYKYSNIWELKNIDKNVVIAGLSYFPIHIKSFEYLMKLKLYNLALDCPFEIKNGRTFFDKFGIEKKYLEFMKQVNVDYVGLNILRKYPTDERDVYDFMRDSCYYFMDTHDIVDAKKLMNYLNDNNIDCYDYYDYIRELENQGYNTKDNSLLYPDNFNERHDRLFVDSIIIKDKDIDDKINALSKIYSMNIYEDDKYIVFPASSIESLVDESIQMSNCVKSYCERISDKDTQIYFMRRKSNKNKSLVTIEVHNNKVVQALGRFNKEISAEEKRIVKKFENSLINIKII